MLLTVLLTLGLYLKISSPWPASTFWRRLLGEISTISKAPRINVVVLLSVRKLFKILTTALTEWVCLRLSWRAINILGPTIVKAPEGLLQSLIECLPIQNSCINWTRLMEKPAVLGSQIIPSPRVVDLYPTQPLWKSPFRYLKQLV